MDPLGQRPCDSYCVVLTPAVTENPSLLVKVFNFDTYASHSGVNFLDSNSASASFEPAKFKTWVAFSFEPLYSILHRETLTPSGI